LHVGDFRLLGEAFSVSHIKPNSALRYPIMSRYARHNRGTENRVIGRVPPALGLCGQSVQYRYKQDGCSTERLAGGHGAIFGPET